MEVKISKAALYDCIQKVYPVVPLKSSLQILSNLKLSFTPEKMEITATDLDHSICVSCAVEVDSDFAITVNAKKLFEIVRELPEGEVALSVDENVLIIKSKKGFSCKIAGSGIEDFPQFPSINNNISFTINIQILKDLIVKSSFAVAKDETRTCLCGVLWIVTKNQTGMVATDGHRLGSSFVSGQFTVPEKNQLIISPKTMLHLTRIFDTVDQNSAIAVSRDEKYALFSNEKIKLCTKLIEGPYPDYEKAIPKNNPKKAIIQKDSFFEAIRRVSVLSNQKTHLVKCLFKDDNIEISVFNRDIGGEAHEIVESKYVGDQHTIGFNAQYLMEILSIIKQPKIRLEMNTQISACLVYSHYEKDEDKKSDDTFLIMPLRIMEEM
jgi:DNA polymerase III subunit beta